MAKKTKKSYSLKNKDINRIDDVLEQLEWTDDFGFLSEDKQREVIANDDTQYFEKLYELKEKLSVLPNL